jgi:hypothetical protein
MRWTASHPRITVPSYASESGKNGFEIHCHSLAGMVPSVTSRSTSLAGILMARDPTRTLAILRRSNQALAVAGLMFNIAANSSIRSSSPSLFMLFTVALQSVKSYELYVLTL